jgi:ANTAR domain/GAF domain
MTSGSEPPNAESIDHGTALLFAHLADLVYTGHSYDQILEDLVAAAPAMVSGCDHASLMLRRDDGNLVTAAASDEVGYTIDALEREVGDGPCVDAITDEAWQLDSNLQRSSQWPQLARRVVAETPVRGMAGFRTLVRDTKVGALNFFSDTPDALTPASATEGAIVAAFVSVALAAADQHEEAATLRAGLESNREIGKAIGLLMAGHKINSDAAFAQLKKASQDLNLKIADVAREVVDYHNRR